MFKNLFKRKTEKTEVKKPEVCHIEVTKEEVESLERDISDSYNPLVTRFRDTTTGEIIEVAFGDHEAFNKCMGNKNMQLVFN